LTRLQRRLLIAVGVFVFLAISLLLTKAFVGAGAERAKVVDLVRAEARGDAAAVLAQLPRCRADATCAQLSRARTARLRRPGTVQILNFVPSVQVAMTDRAGTARVAWRTDRRQFPVVQCVRVERKGPLTGGGVSLVSVSDPIALDGSC
jgi:hypothetical protein